MSTLDNRELNLREVSMTQQRANQKKCRVFRGKSPRSRFKGLGFHPGRPKQWNARVKKDGIVHSFGYYVTEEEAALAYNKAATELFGEFARLNEV